VGEPAPLPPGAPPGPSAARQPASLLDALRLRLRQAGWATAIGAGTLLLWSLFAQAASEALLAVVPRLASTAEGRVALATLLSSSIAALLAGAVSLLAGLAADLPLPAGALGGALALALPVLLPWLSEGPDDSPQGLRLARLASLLLGAAAGVCGLVLSRRLLARTRRSRPLPKPP
jgi:hypothetical protein